MAKANTKRPPNYDKRRRKNAARAAKKPAKAQSHVSLAQLAASATNANAHTG